MKTYYKAASWDLLLTLFTIGLNLLGLVLILMGPNPITIAIFGGILLLSPFFMIKGYSLEGPNLIIHRLGWTTPFKLQEFRYAEVNAEVMKGSWRKFGNGGLYGWIGKFSNGSLGTFRAFATNRNKCVVLTFTDKTLVLTPEDPAAFVEHLNNRTSH